MCFKGGGFKMVVNLAAEKYRKAAQKLRDTKERLKGFLTKHERAALGCAAHRAEAEANLIERMLRRGDDVRD
jgi:hypothetical protein